MLKPETTTRTTRAWTQLDSIKQFKRWLTCIAVGLAACGGPGCSSSSQFSSSPGLISKLSAQRRPATNSQVAQSQSQAPIKGSATQDRFAGQNARSSNVAAQANAANNYQSRQAVTQPSSTAATSPTQQLSVGSVVPVSYNEDRPVGNLASTQQPSTSNSPMQLAGLRRNSAPTCQPGSGCGCNTETALPAECGCATCEPQRWDIDPQEFICDGGDKDPATSVREDWGAVGVDTTDTVMYYETLGGKVCVKPTNRTCVYAPRFGSVRQVTGAALASNTLAPGRVHLPQAAIDVLDRSSAGNLELATKPIGQKQVQMLDRLNDQQRHIPIDMVLPPTPIGTVVSPKINVDRTLTDEALNREWLELLDGRVEVVTLINPESLVVLLSEQQAHIVKDIKQAAEFYLYETPDKCSMRITKTASHQMASPGDRIRFTIRFENVGSQKLGNAVIMDSLSPRLSYVDGSQHSSVEADFSIQPNDAGSSVLRWSITKPIDGQKGGVISFDCDVR